MTYSGGQAGPGTYQQWPVAGDQQPRRYGGARPDPIAFLLLLIGGACGLAQYLVAGYPVGQSFVAEGTVVTGKNLMSILATHGTPTDDVTRIGLIVTTVGGGALVLLALATLLPITHRPLGGAALVVSLGSGASAVWLLAQSSSVLGSPASALLDGSQLGWYLTAAAALIGLIGAFKALGG